MDLDYSTLVSALNYRGEKQKELHKKACQIRDETIGNDIYFRGLIEVSNFCKNDCYYCGIRRENTNLKRYQLPIEEVKKQIQEDLSMGFHSLVLQSGERNDPTFISYLINILEYIQEQEVKIHVTLSCGEQTKDTYQRLFDAGAHRYLLRIETTNEPLYNKLHPHTMSHQNRIQCLKDLRDIGYQVGTGILIGSPGQTLEDLATDLLWMKEQDIDMVGMGPYVHHPDTPIGKKHPELSSNAHNQERLNTSLNMIALLRLLMPTINIASTTALSALDPTNGQRKGLQAGANVLMPQTTPQNYREDYQLYTGKPNLQVVTKEGLQDLIHMVESLGLKSRIDTVGDPPHFHLRKEHPTWN